MNTMLGSLKCEYPALSPDTFNTILDGIQASIRQKVKGQCHEYPALSPDTFNALLGKEQTFTSHIVKR